MTDHPGVDALEQVFHRPNRPAASPDRGRPARWRRPHAGPSRPRGGPWPARPPGAPYPSYPWRSARPWASERNTRGAAVMDDTRIDLGDEFADLSAGRMPHGHGPSLTGRYGRRVTVGLDHYSGISEGLIRRDRGAARARGRRYDQGRDARWSAPRPPSTGPRPGVQGFRRYSGSWGELCGTSCARKATPKLNQPLAQANRRLTAG